MIIRRVPVAPPSVPRRGNRISVLIGRLVLTALGWRIEGNVPDVPKFVIAWAPHTSYWDWVVCISALVSMRLDISWMAASELFWWPFGPILTWLGGVPIDRSAHHGVVDNMVRQFAEKQKFVLSIAPEGTRSKVINWKTGFYYIARGASVPIALVSLDYAKKVIAIGPTVDAGPDGESNILRIRSHFRNVSPMHPHKSN